MSYMNIPLRPEESKQTLEFVHMLIRLFKEKQTDESNAAERFYIQLRITRLENLAKKLEEMPQGEASLMVLGHDVTLALFIPQRKETQNPL